MYDIGDVVPLTIEIRDANGVLANAGAVTLTVGLPDGSSVTPSVASPSTGRYQCDFQTTQVGRHYVRWLATGSNASAYSDAFDVHPVDLGGILSMTEAKAALNIPTTDTGSDDEIRAMVEAITRVIEDYRGETIVRRTVVEQIWTYRSRCLVLSKSPIISLTTVYRLVDDYTWPAGDLLVRDAQIGEISLNPYALLFSGEITVTYVAGYPVVPPNFIEAAKIILQYNWQTQQTPGMGVRVFGGSPDDTSTVVGLGFAIPNRAAQFLGGRAPAVAG